MPPLINIPRKYRDPSTFSINLLHSFDGYASSDRLGLIGALSLDGGVLAASPTSRYGQLYDTSTFQQTKLGTYEVTSSFAKSVSIKDDFFVTGFRQFGTARLGRVSSTLNVLVPNPGTTGNLFGTHVNMIHVDGDSCVFAVSAIYQDVGANTRKGVIYIFRYNGSSVSLITTLSSPVNTSNQYWGSMSSFYQGVGADAYMLVTAGNYPSADMSGAWMYSVSTAGYASFIYKFPGNGFYSKRAVRDANYVVLHAGNTDNLYVYDVVSHSLLADIPASFLGAASTNYGLNIALSNGKLAIGDYANGHRQVILYNIPTQEIAFIPSPSPTAGGFGYGLAMDGNYLAVGSYDEDTNGLTDNGRVHLYSIAA